MDHLPNYYPAPVQSIQRVESAPVTYPQQGNIYAMAAYAPAPLPEPINSIALAEAVKLQKENEELKAEIADLKAQINRNKNRCC